jgi:hypothetical protein
VRDPKGHMMKWLNSIVLAGGITLCSQLAFANVTQDEIVVTAKLASQNGHVNDQARDWLNSMGVSFESHEPPEKTGEVVHAEMMIDIAVEADPIVITARKKLEDTAARILAKYELHLASQQEEDEFMAAAYEFVASLIQSEPQAVQTVLDHYVPEQGFNVADFRPPPRGTTVRDWISKGEDLD